MTTIERIPVHCLRAGDIMSGTGEEVLMAYAGVMTPRGKMEVILHSPDGGKRRVVWGRHTVVGIRAEG